MKMKTERYFLYLNILTNLISFTFGTNYYPLFLFFWYSTFFLRTEGTELFHNINLQQMQINFHVDIFLFFVHDIETFWLEISIFFIIIFSSLIFLCYVFQHNFINCFCFWCVDLYECKADSNGLTNGSRRI